MTQRELFTLPELGNADWYSTAVRYGGLIWVCGQIPRRSDGTMPEETRAQVEQTIDNLERALGAAGGDLGTVLKINTYLASFDDFDTYNEVYVSRLGSHGLPPRTTVEVVRFPLPMRIEIEAVAHVRDRP